MKPIINHETMFSKYDKAQIVQFYPNVNVIIFNNYTSEKSARDMKDKYSVGVWKQKTI